LLGFWLQHLQQTTWAGEKLVAINCGDFPFITLNGSQLFSNSAEVYNFPPNTVAMLSRIIRCTEDWKITAFRNGLSTCGS
jgi:hypothetical protein